MSQTKYNQMTAADIGAMFAFAPPNIVEKFLIHPTGTGKGVVLFIDPITIISVIVEVGTYLNEQYKNYNEQQWQDDVTARLNRIEQQLNTLSNLVNDLFSFTQGVVALQSIYEQNGFLASSRAMLETVMRNSTKFDSNGWPQASGAQINIVQSARNFATAAAGVFTRTEIYGYMPFISVYAAATTETTAMLVTPETKRTDVADRLDFYIAYFKQALGNASNGLLNIRNGLKSVLDQSSIEIDNYPKYGSIGISKPSVMDPEYDPNAEPPTNPRNSWSMFRIDGNKDDGFVSGPVTHTFEWQTPDKILPQYPGITFANETWDVERVAMILNYLNPKRVPYLKAKAKYEGAELQIVLAQKILDQLLIFQKTLMN